MKEHASQLIVRGLRLGLLGALFVVGAGVALGAVRDSSPPISSTTSQDPSGDAAGSRLDISSLSASLAQDGTLTITVQLANNASPASNESMSLQLSTESGALMQIVAYQNETDLQVVSGGSWQTIHQAPGGFINGVFQEVVALSDLRDAVHVAVTPSLSLRALAYSFDPSGAATQVDAAPDNGWMTVRTAAPSTTTTTTNSNPPYIVEQYQTMAKARVKWKRLAVRSVPANANVTIGCKKVCKLFEQLHVVAGAAVSKKFAGVPFPSGTTFVVRVDEPGNSGYWFSRTVVGKKGQQVTSATGCIASGKLSPIYSC